MHLTRVGFGAWAIGGGGWTFSWGNQDDAQSIGAIRKAVESGVNWIDLYQMHWPAADGTAVQEYWQVFADLKREGKVRAIGLSNHNVAPGRGRGRRARGRHPAAVQPDPPGIGR
jgi:aryl-alcohol dehydrogenase-like predicted oxidoreductase